MFLDSYVYWDNLHTYSNAKDNLESTIMQNIQQNICKFYIWQIKEILDLCRTNG